MRTFVQSNEKNNSAMSREQFNDLPVSVSLVIPGGTEPENLPFLLNRIPSWVDEVILVDDDEAIDGTVDVARSLLPGIKVIGQDRPGRGAALRAGFAVARGEIIVVLDADGSTDPVEIPAFVGALLAGADFVQGSPAPQAGGAHDPRSYRRIGNWGFVKMVTWRSGSKPPDLYYGCHAFWRDLLKSLRLDDIDEFENETTTNGSVAGQAEDHRNPRRRHEAYSGGE